MNVSDTTIDSKMAAYNVTTTGLYNMTLLNITISNATYEPTENVTETPERHVVTQDCSDIVNTTPDTIPTSHDALLYIVVVLLFYAFSMVILMVKYIRREREEAEMAHYYSEFVSRDRFKTPMFEVRNCMRGLKIKHSKQFTSSSIDQDEDDFVSCSEVPLVGKDHRLYIGEETKI